MDTHDTTPHPAGPRASGYGTTPRDAPAAWRYLCLLWKRRFLIAGTALLPAVLLALLLSLWPRKYTAAFVYERPLSESHYNILLRRFHSRENLDRIIRQLRGLGLGDYARRFDEARTEKSLEKLIRFEVSPAYPKRLQTTDPATSEQIGAFQARLLSVRITGDTEAQVLEAATVLTGNLENVLPLYDVRVDLKGSIQQYRILAAQIEETRFSLMLDLQREQAKLEKLKGIEAATSEVPQGNIVLQFNDVLNSREFLPLSYQIRAVQARIIDLQEQLSSDAEKYRLHLQILDLNDRLLRKIEESLLTDFTLQQFVAFLGEQLPACQDQALSDYLKSYIRKTENLILVNTRAGERPVVYPVPRNIAARSVLAFVGFLMVGVFLAVVFEYRQPRHRPA